MTLLIDTIVKKKPGAGASGALLLLRCMYLVLRLWMLVVKVVVVVVVVTINTPRCAWGAARHCCRVGCGYHKPNQPRFAGGGVCGLGGVAGARSMWSS